jgi:triosephosphate isomerase
MNTLIVGNWKMHLTPAESVRLVKKLQERIPPNRDVGVVLCPPFIDLIPVKEVLERGHFSLGAQNCHEMDEGAYTGEISATMLRGIAEYVLIGHSERRQQFREDDKTIAKKVAAAIRNGLKPILCVGETLDERNDGLSTKVVTAQVTAGLSMLTSAEVSKVSIAYEPVWAIGSGVTATPRQITPMITAIKSIVHELYLGDEPVVRILYGAGVEPEFVTSILSIPHVSGLLVGGASIHYEKFSQIVITAQEIARAAKAS